MRDSLTVAAVQLCSTDDVAANLATCRRLAAVAADGGAQVIVLPECFAFLGQREGDKMKAAEVIDAAAPGPILSCLLELATRHRALVVGGGMPEVVAGDPARSYNTAVAVGPDGALVACYRKIHLFDVDIPARDESYRESAFVAPGDSPRVLDTPAGRLGLAVCYDMRFPELFRAMSAAGAQWFVLPSAFTVPTGRAHWETLLRARAIENLAYVVASAQSGLHQNGRETWGDSLIVDHWGAVLARLPAGEGVVTAELDLEAQARTRSQFPALGHRRL